MALTPPGAAFSRATLSVKGRDGACCVSLHQRDRKCTIGAEIAEMGQHADADGVAGNALAGEFPGCVLGKRRGESLRGSQALRVEQAQYGTAPRRLEFSKSHAVSGKHARQRMDEHTADPERIGNEAGMLPADAAEGVQHVAGDV